MFILENEDETLTHITLEALLKLPSYIQHVIHKSSFFKMKEKIFSFSKMIKILKIFFLKNEKIFKTFLKMKYNRLLSFIYKKEFCRLYRHRATAHNTKGEPQQMQITRGNSTNRSQEGKETQKRKKFKKIKTSTF